MSNSPLITNISKRRPLPLDARAVIERRRPVRAAVAAGTNRCGLTKLLGRAWPPVLDTPPVRDRLAGWATGSGAGGAPTVWRFTGALFLGSTPGVRLSFGTGDSAWGLKVGRWLSDVFASEF
jgi:hypothetical protein